VPARLPISLRALAIGFALSVLCGLLIPYLDHYVQGTFVGGQHLPPGAIFVLLLLVLAVNPLLRLLSRRLPLNRAELVLIYAMLLVSTLIPGHGSEAVFIPVSVSPFYYATPANGWERLFHQQVPTWFRPQAESAVIGFYESLSPGTPIPWGQWVVPLLAWTVMLLALYALATFLSVLLYPQWADYEKLTFPLVALPMEMSDNPGTPFASRHFWGNPLMWVGFTVAVLLGAGKGLGFYYPQFASFRLEYQSLHVYFREEPLASISWTPMVIYPLVIAVSVLLRTEISGSLVFFYWFTKIERVIASAFGYRQSGLTIAGYPLWLAGQPWGGYLAYTGMGLWVARRHLASAWRQLRGHEEPSGDQPLSYRLCLIGGAVSLGIGTAWLVAGGMSVWSAALTMLCYAMIIVILSKVVAEAGLLFVQQSITPDQMLNYFFGTNTVGARALTAGMFFDRAFGTDLRATVMPSFVQGLRIADEAKLSKRWMVIAFWVAILGSLPTTYWCTLRVFYRYGGVNCDPWFGTWSGNTGWYALSAWLTDPRPANVPLLLSTAVGAFTVWAVSVLRQRYLWFSLHPVGFVMMQTYPMHMMWLSILIAWVLKVTILRYGGPKGLRTTLPMFLGIAFGDIFMMGFWLIVAGITGKHRLFLLPG
jgi:hypothetical protein